MVRRMLAAVLIALCVAPAGAGPVAPPPSAMMAELNKLIPDRDGAVGFIVTFHVETADKASVERCLKVFSENGIARPASISLSSPTLPTVYQFDGARQYVMADGDADKLAALIAAAAAPGQVTWAVSSISKGWSALPATAVPR